MTPRDDLEPFRECRRACLAAVRHALDADGPRLDDAQLSLLLDGAELCETSIRFRRRNSMLHPRVGVLCVEICERCIQLCSRFPDDPIMQTCRNACARCAEFCGQLAGDPRAGGTPESGPGRPADKARAADCSADDARPRARA